MRYLLIALALNILVYAKDYSLDLGAALGTITFPSYMGSKTNQNYTLPFPYVIYKSDYLDIDTDGIRTTLFDIKDLVLDLSLGGSLPADSKDLKAREGMPNLDFTFEFGPRITYKFFNHGVANLYFELPARAVYSTDLSNLVPRGYITTPQFKYALEYKNFEFSYRLGALFASEGYNDYFYEVAPQYATSTRQAYDAKGGYDGLKNRLTVTYTTKRWFAGAFVSYYDLHNTVYENSPLVETKYAIYFGASLAYIFYTSK